jgi:hypothetical protein
MRNSRIILGLVLAIGAAGTASAQEYRGTWEQQMACTPDVWRLCSDQVPDVNRIVSCLHQNSSSLSSGCRAVFESNNSMPPSQSAPTQSPRGRVAPPPPARVAPVVPPTSTEDDDD